jgi:flavin-dependent dehydrogenase
MENRVTGYDLIVIGAGPAGCATAITAASSGAKVLLLERGRFPRHKVCGEFVSAESLDLLEQLLCPSDRNLIWSAPRIPKGRVFLDGAEIHTQINPPAASITRFAMDAALWRACIEHQVEVREGCTAQSIEGAGRFTVKTQSETFEAKALVNASGRWSNLTTPRAPAEERWIGIKAHFAEPCPPASVDLYFFDTGYCGVQPIAHENGSGAVNACAMVSARGATTMQDVLGLHPALRERSQHWQPLMQPVTTSPLIFHKPEPVKRRILQVGDAATFVDPFVGDGISLAIRGGVLAAECLTPFLFGNWQLDEAVAEYNLRYQRRLARVFRASSMLRRLLACPLILRRPALAFLQRRPALANRLVEMTR